MYKKLLFSLAQKVGQCFFHLSNNLTYYTNLTVGDGLEVPGRLAIPGRVYARSNKHSRSKRVKVLQLGLQSLQCPSTTLN